MPARLTPDSTFEFSVMEPGVSDPFRVMAWNNEDTSCNDPNGIMRLSITPPDAPGRVFPITYSAADLKENSKTESDKSEVNVGISTSTSTEKK